MVIILLTYDWQQFEFRFIFEHSNHEIHFFLCDSAFKAAKDIFLIKCSPYNEI